jgi:3-hydroxyacyl-[acyl-carrier-protein] dehydratase
MSGESKRLTTRTKLTKNEWKNMKEIKKLLPHRHPFLFVDEIISARQDEIIGVKIFDESMEFLNGHFPEFKIVPGTILVEAMAQCGGAGIKKLYPTRNGLFSLATIESVKFHKSVECGQTVKTVVKNLRVGEKVIKQSGVSYVNDIPVVEAIWMCVKLAT